MNAQDILNKAIQSLGKVGQQVSTSDVFTKAVQSAELQKVNPQSGIVPAVAGFAQNTGLDIAKLLLSIPASVEQAGQMQKQYGTPMQLAMKNPLEYVKVMTSPITGAVKQLASYTPIQDIASGDIGNYPGRVGKQIYKNPASTALDAASVIGLAKALNINPENVVAGNKMKLESAQELARSNVSPEQAQLVESRQNLRAGPQQLQPAVQDNIDKTVEVLKRQQIEETASQRKPNLSPQAPTGGEIGKYSNPEDIKAFKTNILTENNLQRNLQELSQDGIKPDENGLITLYRGEGNKGRNDFRAFSSFTTDIKLAKRFGGSVKEIKVNPADLVITNRMGEGITFQNPVNLVKGENGVHGIEPVSGEILKGVK